MTTRNTFLTPLRLACTSLVRPFLIVTMLLAFLSVTVSPVLAQAKSDFIRINKVRFDERELTLQLSAQGNSKFQQGYQLIHLPNPNRVILEIPNATFTTRTKGIQVQTAGIDHIELSQSAGVFYQVARVVIVANNPNALSRVRLQPMGNTLSLNLNDPTVTPTASQPTQPLPVPGMPVNLGPMAGRPVISPPIPGVGAPLALNLTSKASNLTIIKSVQFTDGKLMLASLNGFPLEVKNQFTLAGPNRLVIDLAKATLADKSLMGPYQINTGVVQSVRLGQFDDTTVRMVVETPTPKSIAVQYIGPGRDQLAVGPSNASVTRQLALDNQKLTEIINVGVSRQGETVLVTVNGTQPITRRVVGRNNLIDVELVNAQVKTSGIGFDQTSYPEIKDIRLYPSQVSGNSKLLITTDAANLPFDTIVSEDGRQLTIYLSPQKNTPRIISGLDIPQGPAKGTKARRSGPFVVVVDAGHGGKDKGANREGVLEKNLNLTVAKRLRAALEAKGIVVHMTRDTDKFLALSEICAITNRIQPDAFVSVHTNASLNPAVTGLETYYYTPQSKSMAYTIHKHAAKAINSPNHGVRTAKFYVVHHTEVPAVLFEMGYISNASERADLQSDARQSATAESISQGVLEFLNATYRPN